jgi:hypothetical protein
VHAKNDAAKRFICVARNSWHTRKIAALCSFPSKRCWRHSARIELAATEHIALEEWEGNLLNYGMLRNRLDGARERE